MSPHLKVLSLSYTRELWSTTHDADRSRLLNYAANLGRYTAVVFSRKRHGLRRCQLAANFSAYPTGGYSPVDNWWRALVLGFSELRREQYDLIQCQDPAYSGSVGLVLSWLCRIPLNVCVYGPNPFDPHFAKSSWRSRIYSLVATFVLRRSDGIQVDGAATEASLLEHGIPDTRVRRKSLLATDIDSFNSVNRDFPDGKAEVRLLYVGRLARQKNLDGLLTVISRLGAHTHKKIQLEIIGEGPEIHKLKKIARRLGVHDIVTFSGAQSRQEVKNAFARSDIFILSSQYEGFPRVLLEAALAGVSAITTSVSGASELVVDGETGYVVPIGDWDRLAERIQILVSDDHLRRSMSTKARTHGQLVLDRTHEMPSQVEIWERLLASN